MASGGSSWAPVPPVPVPVPDVVGADEAPEPPVPVPVPDVVEAVEEEVEEEAAAPRVPAVLAMAAEAAAKRAPSISTKLSSFSTE